MRKIVFSINICLLLCCLFIACDKKTVQRDNDVQFDSLEVKKEYHFKNDSEKPSCNLDIVFRYPASYTNANVLTKIQSVFVRKFFGEAYKNMLPEEAVAAYKKQYFSDFESFQTNLELVAKDIEEDEREAQDETQSAYYLKAENKIIYNKNNIISFIVEYNDYAGGAHGSKSTYAYVINLGNGSLLTEDDIFNENTKSQMSKVIVSKIEKQNGLSNAKQLEDIGYDNSSEIKPNGNFALDSNGITYFYNEDEISPYIMGQTKVFLPYNEIDIYLNDESPAASLWR